jgi:hypothetical protein
MPIYTQKYPKQLTNGNCVGILDADWLVPYIPGDVTNASTFDFPVLYKMVEGLDLKLVLQGDKSQSDAIVNAVVELEQQGVKCITGDCGFLIHYQEEAADAVDVPVFLSSLLQLPLVEHFIGRNKSVALVCADRSAVDGDVLRKAGSTESTTIIVEDLLETEEFAIRLLQPSECLDSDKSQREVVKICQRLQAENPKLGAFLFECSMLPPYSHAAQAATGLPVFDFITMINLFQKSTHRRPFTGYF